MGGLSAKDVAWAVENCPPQLVAVVVIAVLVAVITYRVNKLVSGWLSELETAKRQREKQGKQLHKVIVLVTSAPCIDKANGVWLGDENRNGGQPPEAIKCKYEEAKRRVEP